MGKRISTINQLDSLRSIAAFGVIFHHFLPELHIGYFPFGKYGVEIFFVISGFLISSILLEQKKLLISRTLIIKNFIIKRALRIFPIYYLYLLFFTLLSLKGLWVWNKGEGIYFYTYTTNILYTFHGLRSIQVNHLWTLAIEEQFYIFWPWILIFTPKSKELVIIIPLILLSIVFKLFINPDARLLTISHLDSLCTGSLLAYLSINQKAKYFGANWLKNNKETILLFLLLSFFLLSYLFSTKLNSIIILCISTLLVYGCHIGFTGWFGWLLNIKFIQYLGKISYGLYLYHKCLPFFFTLLQRKLNIYVDSYIALLILLAMTILIAHLSYIFIEKPFLRLKDRFDL